MRSLTALKRLRARLGEHWSYLVSDVTAGKAGCQERLAYLYDTRKVHFLGMAGELVLPPLESGKKRIPAQQVVRTPLMAAFPGRLDQIRPHHRSHPLRRQDGGAAGADREDRTGRAKFLRARTEDPGEEVHNFIALGDFNLIAEGDKTMKALTEAGDFTIPEQIKTVPGSNLTGEKKYDQIAYRSREGRFEATGNAGVTDYYRHVFRDADAGPYRPYIDEYIAARRKAARKPRRSRPTRRPQ